MYKAFALQGDKFVSVITQGDALGSELLPFQGVWSLLAKLKLTIYTPVHELPLRLCR